NTGVQTVATFTDANLSAPLADFTTGTGGASIDWGDGTSTTAGTITQPGGVGTAFVVSGSHTYAIGGSYTIPLNVTDKGGSTASATSTGLATELVVAGFPTPVTAGNSYNFTVTALDQYGNTNTGYTGTVTFSSSARKAVLPASYTFTSADKGVHTFSA